MAKAKKVTDTYAFILKLTTDEAMALKWVLGKVGGDPDNTPRKHIDSIDAALGKIGIEPIDWPTSDGSALYFGAKK